MESKLHIDRVMEKFSEMIVFSTENDRKKGQWCIFRRRRISFFFLLWKGNDRECKTASFQGRGR